jgi:hypothetical protein
MAQEQSKSGPGMAFYRRGRVRGWCMHRGPWWEWSFGGACLGARGNFAKGQGCYGNGSIFQEVRPEDKMATDLQMATLLFYQ